MNLPEDLEPFVDDYDEMHEPGVYCLKLTRPHNVATAWDRHFDHRPEWFEEFQDATECVYVGASMNLLERLTDHKDGEKRLTVLTEICEIDGLHTVWHALDVSDWSELGVEERKMARWLKESRATWFIRQQ